MTIRPLSSMLLVALAACSGPGSADAPAPANGASGTPSSDDGGTTDVDAEAATPTEACAPVATKTKCTSGGDAAIVRGVAHFDPSAHAVSTKSGLALFLRHPWTLEVGEEKLGGRLHMFSWKKLTADQRTSGRVPFEIDLCGLGAEMWSDENGAFNVVAMLDETGENQATLTGDAQAWQAPRDGELAKLVAGVDLSCHGSSPCLDVPLDCVGPSCTTIEPVKSVQCRTPSCPSDDAFCSNPSGQH